jgi:decaprenylphospho-beta-D-erythro-pentofuranosid-2-ulose 2-reductase
MRHDDSGAIGMKKVLIIGATSAIAEATARLWAQKGYRLYLVARNEERLKAMAADLSIRGAEVRGTCVLEVSDFSRHEEIIERGVQALDGLDLALIAHGTLSDQKACERDFKLALQELNTNAISVVSLVTKLANHFEAQKHGTIAVISSVAGDRGRQSNYVYGAAKGMVTILLQGVRQRVHRSGVHVLTIKPGFVDTPMTGSFEKGILWSKPDKIAKDINRSIENRRCTVYTPGFWRLIMFAIHYIPEYFFKKLRL